MNNDISTLAPCCLGSVKSIESGMFYRWNTFNVKLFLLDILRFQLEIYLSHVARNGELNIAEDSGFRN